MASANTIATTELKSAPNRIVSFSNDLYAEVKAPKKYIQKFLSSGKIVHELSEELKEKDESESIDMMTGKDGEVVEFLLHGCNGVFTDENGKIYFWRLSSPSILSLTSQDYESAFLYLKNPNTKLLEK